MTSGAVENRETSYIADAVTFLQQLFDDSKETAVRLILLRVLLSALLGSPAKNQVKDWSSSIITLQDLLLAEVARILRSERWQDQGLLLSLAALEAVAALPKQTIRDSLSDCVPSLLNASSQHLENGIPAVGWEIRTFLADYFLDSLWSPLKIKYTLQGGSEGDEGTIDKATLLQYTDAVVHDAGEDTKLAYLEDMLQQGGKDGSSDTLGRLLVIHRLIQHTKGQFQFHCLCNRNKRKLTRTRDPNHRSNLDRGIRPRQSAKHSLPPAISHQLNIRVHPPLQTHLPTSRPTHLAHDTMEYRAHPKHRRNHLLQTYGTCSRLAQNLSLAMPVRRSCDTPAQNPSRWAFPHSDHRAPGSSETAAFAAGWRLQGGARQAVLAPVDARV